MPKEPTIKRVFTFFDGQNLFFAAKEAFEYNYPNYHPKRLAEYVCSLKEDWRLHETRFYTGIPPHAEGMLGR